MAESEEEREEIAVGRITAPHGIKGWVKVFSYTDPIEQIFAYVPWTIVKGKKKKVLKLADRRRQGKGLVVLAEGYSDRDQAALLSGWEIRINKSRLPALEDGEFYWHQLEGMRVINLANEEFGQVDYLLETGAHDVLVVRPTPSSIDDRERMIPFVEDEIVKLVDLEEERIQIDWDSDF